MPRKIVALTDAHIREVLQNDIIIGSDSVTHARFVFNPWANEYRVYVNGEQKFAGNAIEEMLDEYNKIIGAYHE